MSGDLDAKLAALAAKTREGFATRAKEMRALADRAEQGDERAVLELRRAVHQLRGIAGTAGHPDLSDRAGELELACVGGLTGVALAEAARVLAEAAERAATQPPSERSSPAASERPALADADQRWRAVAIDDDPSTRRLLELTLAQNGEAFVFEDPRAAITKVREGSIDLVVLDAMMPEVNGLEIYRAIRRENASLPIAILSAAGPDELGWELPDDPLLVWLRKPFRPAHLLDALRELARRSR